MDISLFFLLLNSFFYNKCPSLASSQLLSRRNFENTHHENTPNSVTLGLGKIKDKNVISENAFWNLMFIAEKNHWKTLLGLSTLPMTGQTWKYPNSEDHVTPPWFLRVSHWWQLRIWSLHSINYSCLQAISFKSFYQESIKSQFYGS